MNIEEAVHYSDLYFVNYCDEKYGINRGVYNTIDSWFYAQGMDNILERRKHIIQFLEFIRENSNEEKPRIKFGNGGLKVKLNHYIYSKEELTYLISKEMEA